MTVKGLCRLGQGGRRRAPDVRLVMLRLASCELLALATASRPRHALARYRARWRRWTWMGFSGGALDLSPIGSFCFSAAAKLWKCVQC
jgi:hypothetical protein